MTYSLKDKDVLIVGGGSDIAAALAADLLQEGARVTLAGRDAARTAAAAKAIGDTVRAIALDLSDEESIRVAADQAGTAGGLDHLVSWPRSGPPDRSPPLNVARCSRPSTPRPSVRSCWPSTSPR